MGHERIATECICCANNQLQKSPAILMPFVAHRVFGWAPVKIDASWGLRTITDGMAYTLCQSLFCEQCQCLFLEMRFSDQEMRNLYDGYRDEKYTALRESYEPGYQKRNEKLLRGADYLDRIEHFLMPYLSFPITILDYGGDTGINTPFKNKNAHIYLYDINEPDLNANTMRVGRSDIKKYAYDLIICSHLLEHVPYPVETLRDIKTLMSHKTILYIELPFEKLMREMKNGENISSKKRHWHEHINFFSLSSLKALLQLSGFEIIKIEILTLQSDVELAHAFQIICTVA